MTAVRDTIGELLQGRIGLDVASISPKVLQHAIRDRVKATGAKDEAGYLDVLEHDADERQALIDAVVVPETWFFRDAGPFAYLDAWLGERDGAGPAPKSLRVLSMPCASGEEPYSIALTLAGFPGLAQRAVIQAVDISRQLLVRAKEGVYGRHALRAMPASLLERYFTPTPEGQVLDPSIRSRVSFFHANALEFPGDPPGASYDLVFCRNLLIYLDQSSRRRLAEILDRLLAPGGVLFLGHAEVPHLFCPTYRPVRWPKAFAAIKPAAGLEKPGGAAPAVPPAVRAAPPERARAGRAAPRPASTPARPASGAAGTLKAAPVEDPDELLRQARDHADRGVLEAARQCCQAVLQLDRSRAEAYHILGLVAEASRDDARALEMFQKVVYLAPRHVAALTQLSLILERLGRLDQARRYRDRARRVDREREDG